MKTNNKKILAIKSGIAITIIIAIIFTTLISYNALASYGVRPTLEARAENVILLIGDGMGFNHIEVASYYDTPVMTTIENTSSVTTRSTSIRTTDSAAAATAMATGVKVWTRRISYSNGSNLVSLGDMTTNNDKKLGIITTKSVTDATPAAFTAHNKSRKNHKQIALEQVNNTGIDVLFGPGREYFDQHSEIINSDDRAYVTNYQDLINNNKPKIYGIFDDPIPNEGDLSLAALTEIALSMLENENGFFLMVEGAKIDTYSHSNEMDKMLAEFWAFDRAVAVALDYAANNPNTTVIVTSDHECGKLTLPETLSNDTINDKLFRSGQHTFRDVPFFIIGPGETEIPKKIDNTDIFHIIKQLLFD